MGLIESFKQGNPPVDPPNLTLALSLAAKGFFVFPVAGKSPPLVFWRRDGAATTDPGTIRTYWGRHPEAAVGIDCKKSKILVVDCDFDGEGHDINCGWTWLWNRCRKEHREALECVPGSRSPGKGRHLVFRNVEPPLGDGRGTLPDKSVCNIDIKGTGYIIAPGTIMTDGSAYQPVGSLDDLPPLPDWLRKILEPKAAEQDKPKTNGANGHHAGNGHDHTDLPPLEGAELVRCLAYGRGLLASVAAELALVAKGNRNNAANNAGLRVGHFVGGGCIEEGEALAVLDGSVRANHGPGEEADVVNDMKSVRNGVRDGKREPKRPLPDEDWPDIKINLKREREKREEQGGEAEETESLLHWLDEEPEIKPEMVDGLIRQTGITFLAGWSSYGKTTALIKLIISLITSLPFHDRKIVRPGGVVIFAADDPDQISGKLRAALYVAKRDGAELSDEFIRRPPVAWITRIPNLQKEEDLVWMKKALMDADAIFKRDYGFPIVAVCYDYLGIVGGWNDENSNAEFSVIKKNMSRISDPLECATVIIHHFGKDISVGLRGPSEMTGAATTILALMGDAGFTEEMRNPRLRVVKYRHGRSHYTLSPYWLEPVSLEEDKPSQVVFRWGKSPIADFVDARAKRMWPKPMLHLQAVMLRLLADDAIARPFKPFPDGPEVVVVTFEEVKADFFKTHQQNEEKAKRVAWTRAITHEHFGQFIVADTRDGITRWWMVKK
jgi:hypothetical protein